MDRKKYRHRKVGGGGDEDKSLCKKKRDRGKEKSEL